LLELGFKRETPRRYVKETDDYLEWVQFTADAWEFEELYCIFDRGLQRFFDEHLDAYKTSLDQRWHPVHLQTRALPGARAVVNYANLQWRKSRRPWRPREYFQDPPKDVSPYGPYISDWGKWYAKDDPEGCAEKSREAWVSAVEEGLRAESIADSHAVARYLVKLDRSFPQVRIGLQVYLGNYDAARALIEQHFALENEPPSETRLAISADYRKCEGISDEEYTANIMRNRRELAGMARQ
jgi:hypothetical protein